MPPAQLRNCGRHFFVYLFHLGIRVFRFSKGESHCFIRLKQLEPWTLQREYPDLKRITPYCKHTALRLFFITYGKQQNRYYKSASMKAAKRMVWTVDKREAESCGELRKVAQTTFSMYSLALQQRFFNFALRYTSERWLFSGV